MTKEEKQTAFIIGIAEGILQSMGGKEIIDSIENEEGKAIAHALMLIPITNKVIDILIDISKKKD